MKTVLITGGAGFVGSSIALYLQRDYENLRIFALDNLKRRGSELNLARLKASGIEFIHGDVRVKTDLQIASKIDIIIDCSAEPSVLAGYTGSPAYVVDSNLIGLLHCLEVAREHHADILFLSTSRVYPYSTLDQLAFRETETRYEWLDVQQVTGVGNIGVSEAYPLDGFRSLYGATKLAGELIIQEYLQMYGLHGIINRCGVLTGPWQMGKVDQGVVVLWVARHILGGQLSYFGYGGQGKQTRDILHIEDLYRLVDQQLQQMDQLTGQVFNVGGGRDVSVSLRELTMLCEEITGVKIDIKSEPEMRPADVRIYLSDCKKVKEKTGWAPLHRSEEIVEEIARWICDHRAELGPILG